ncbi:MAG: hypothetical protein WDZ93_03180 [Candidatus Paceibacterota bacterium]
MSTIMNSSALKRGVVAVLGIALALTLLIPAPHARAQTSAELQAQINQLLVVIAQLQAQLGGGTSICPAGLWSRDLGQGSTGADVLALQRFLNSNSDTRLAVSGAGSPGMETQYYGPITASAVSKFQVKYRAQVLTPLGLVNPTGYFGPSSRVQANMLCTDVTIPDPDDDDDQDDDNALRGGEASLENFDARSGDTNLSEGDDMAEVMDVRFNVKDGDVRISRIDVAFDHVSGGDDDPWDVFDELAILVDGDEIGSVDLSDEDDWNEDDPQNGDYRIRVTNLDTWIVREGKRAEFTVALSVAGSVDDADTGVDWEIFIPDNGIRAVDGLNINHYIGNTNDTVSFDIDEEGGKDELFVRSSSEDPDATTLQLNSNSRSSWLTVFAFDLDTDDSQNDIEVETIPVTVEFSTSTYNALVHDARLVIDGEKYDDFTVTNGASTTATLTFDLDKDLVIDAGDRVTAELEIQFKALGSANEGTTIQSRVDGDDIEAEGADDLGASQLGGSATSDTHTLRSSGVVIGNVTTSETVRDNGTAADTGVYTIRFDVTAFEEDVYVNRTTASGTTMGTAGVNFLVEDSNGDQVGGGSSSAALSSNASVSGNRYRVAEGQTRTFTLSVSYTPAADDFYRVQLYSVNWNDTNADPDVQQRALPEQNYETDYENLDS